MQVHSYTGIDQYLSNQTPLFAHKTRYVTHIHNKIVEKISHIYLILNHYRNQSQSAITKVGRLRWHRRR